MTQKTVWFYDAGAGKSIEFPTEDAAREWMAANDPEDVAFEHPAPDPDPEEAYEVVPMKQEPHGPPADWWTVLYPAHGVRNRRSFQTRHIRNGLHPARSPRR